MNKKITLASAKSFAPEWATHVTVAPAGDSCIFESDKYYQASTPTGHLASKVSQCKGGSIMSHATALKDIN